MWSDFLFQSEERRCKMKKPDLQQRQESMFPLFLLQTGFFEILCPAGVWILCQIDFFIHNVMCRNI